MTSFHIYFIIQNFFHLPMSIFEIQIVQDYSHPIIRRLWAKFDLSLSRSNQAAVKLITHKYQQIEGEPTSLELNVKQTTMHINSGLAPFNVGPTKDWQLGPAIRLFHFMAITLAVGNLIVISRRTSPQQSDVGPTWFTEKSKCESPPALTRPNFLTFFF